MGTAGGIDCVHALGSSANTGTCYFATTETVGETLDAEPVGGSTFVGWTYESSSDCSGSRCPQSDPVRSFTEQGTRAFILLEAYPEHAHLRVVATFAGP